MKKKAVKKISQKVQKIKLIKVGAPLPDKPSFKFVSAHLTQKDTNKAIEKVEKNPRVAAVGTLKIPKQTLLYRKLRITPKRPRIS